MNYSNVNSYLGKRDNTPIYSDPRQGDIKHSFAAIDLIKDPSDTYQN